MQNTRSAWNASSGLPPTGPSQTDPLVYQPQKKTETDEQKIQRYENVYDRLKKMEDNYKK